MIVRRRYSPLHTLSVHPVKIENLNFDRLIWVNAVLDYQNVDLFDQRANILLNSITSYCVVFCFALEHMWMLKHFGAYLTLRLEQSALFPPANKNELKTYYAFVFSLDTWTFFRLLFIRLAVLFINCNQMGFYWFYTILGDVLMWILMVLILLHACFTIYIESFNKIICIRYGSSVLSQSKVYSEYQ